MSGTGPVLLFACSALRIVDALKKRKARPSPLTITGPGAADFMHGRILPVKQPLGVAILSCVFWYSALATLWCERKLFVTYLLCNLHAGEPSRAHQETTATIISGTMQSPPGNDGDHVQAHQEIAGTICSPARNNSVARNRSVFEASEFLEVAKISPPEIPPVHLSPGNATPHFVCNLCQEDEKKKRSEKPKLKKRRDFIGRHTR